jgi:hypothetical protein
MNHCGTCSLCCKLLSVNEIEKPADRWCADCRPGRGCAIYDTRPRECRDFECVWLAAALTDRPLPDELKPTACGAVMAVKRLQGTSTHALQVHVDPGRPLAHREGPLAKYLNNVSRDIAVLVRIGRTYVGIGPLAIEMINTVGRAAAEQEQDANAPTQ